MTGVNATYYTNIPFSSNNPSNDQPLMEQNTNSINNMLSVDHIAFNTSNSQGGYHNIIHMPPQVANPALVSGIGQLFTKTVNTDQELFYESGTGIISQITPFLFSAGLIGYYSLPGGIIIQWGQASGVSGGSFGGGQANGEVTYPKAFPNKPFVVLPIPYYNSLLATPNSAGSVNIDISSITSPTVGYQTKFLWKFNSSSGAYNGFVWIAIGN